MHYNYRLYALNTKESTFPKEDKPVHLREVSALKII